MRCVLVRGEWVWVAGQWMSNIAPWVNVMHKLEHIVAKHPSERGGR